MGYEGGQQEKDLHFGLVEFEGPVRKVQLPRTLRYRMFRCYPQGG